MTLNTKKQETNPLAREQSALTGRLLKIGEDCASRLKEPFRTVDHGSLLYDEKGLPR